MLKVHFYYLKSLGKVLLVWDGHLRPYKQDEQVGIYWKQEIKLEHLLVIYSLFALLLGQKYAWL